MACLFSYAQTSKDFNKLKRSKKYLYSEVTLQDEQQAKDIALINLIKQVNDSLKIEQRNMVVSTNDMKDVCYLVMNRETGVRVLAYCEKVRFLNVQDVDSVLLQDKEHPKGIKVVMVDTPKVDTEVRDLEISEEQQHLQSSISKVKIFDISSTIEQIPSEITKTVVPTTEEWIRNDINSLICQSNINSFIAKLEDMKVRFKIKRWGVSLNECRNIVQAYIAIFNNNGLLASLLSPSDKQRYDYVNKKMIDFATNINNKIIWFQFSK